MADRTSEEYARLATHQQATARIVALVAVLVATLGGLAMIVWGIDHYYGRSGVQVAGIVLGTMLVLGIAFAVAWRIEDAAAERALRHHHAVLDGLTAFQAADDRGEMARTLVTQAAQFGRGTVQLDKTVLRLADNLAQQRAAAATAQEADATDAEWYGLVNQKQIGFDESRW